MRRALAAGIAVAATAVVADVVLNQTKPRSEPSGELIFSTAGLRDIAVARIGRPGYRRLNVAKGSQFDPDCVLAFRQARLRIEQRLQHRLQAAARSQDSVAV